MLDRRRQKNTCRRLRNGDRTMPAATAMVAALLCIIAALPTCRALISITPALHPTTTTKDAVLRKTLSLDRLLSPPPPLDRPSRRTTSSSLYQSSEAQAALDNNNDDDDDDEFEYVEYDMLQEADLAGSEWLVGTNWDANPTKIAETWVRLAVDGTGQNLAVWGDNHKGKWNLDVASQFLSVSQEGLAGKRIWAGVVDDYYYVQGTVRGWNFWSAAAVLGQWQARRLGVTPAEAGMAPWFGVAAAENDTNAGGGTAGVPAPENVQQEA